jgi:uncharacterized protein YceK
MIHTDGRSCAALHLVLLHYSGCGSVVTSTIKNENIDTIMKKSPGNRLREFLDV